MHKMTQNSNNNNNNNNYTMLQTTVTLLMFLGEMKNELVLITGTQNPEDI